VSKLFVAKVVRNNNSNWYCK